MSKKNNFLQRYLEMPDKSGIRNFVFASLILANVANFAIIYLFDTIILKQTLTNTITKIYFVSLTIFDFWSILMMIFPIRLKKLFYLYISIAFTGTSIFCLYLADMILVHELNHKSIPFILISFIIYVMVLLTVIFNIRNKIKTNCSKIANAKYTSSVAFISAAVGVLLPKQSNLGNLPMAILLLVLSYALAFTCSGFHKFYLIVKNKI